MRYRIAAVAFVIISSTCPVVNAQVLCECGLVPCGDTCVAQTHVDNIGCDKVGSAVADTSEECKALLAEKKIAETNGVEAEKKGKGWITMVATECEEKGKRWTTIVLVESEKKRADDEKKRAEEGEKKWKKLFGKNKNKYKKEFKAFLKKNANDPGSVKDVECWSEFYTASGGEDTACITCSFRAKNAYGALILDENTTCESIGTWEEIFKAM